MSSQGRRRHRAYVGGSEPPERLSLDECRKLVGPPCRLSDAELLQLRDQLYKFADVVVSLLPEPAARESLEERAAIMEFDGGISGDAASIGAMIRNIKGRR